MNNNCALCQMPLDNLALDETPYDELIGRLENTIRIMPSSNKNLLTEARNNLHDKANQRHGYRQAIEAQIAKVPTIHEACATRNLRLQTSHTELLTALVAAASMLSVALGGDALTVLRARTAIENAGKLTGV